MAHGPKAQTSRSTSATTPMMANSMQAEPLILQKGSHGMRPQNTVRHSKRHCPQKPNGKRRQGAAVSLGTDPKTATKKTYALTHGDLKPQPVPSPTTNCRPAKCLNCATQIPFRSISHTKERVLTAMHTSAEMSGNMFETFGTPRPICPPSRLDPSGPGTGDIHTLRGGGWNTFSTNMRSANRFHDLVMGSAAGFRCARSWTRWSGRFHPSARTDHPAGHHFITQTP